MVHPREVPKVLLWIAGVERVGKVLGRIVAQHGDVDDEETDVVTHAVLIEIRAAKDCISITHRVLHDVSGRHDVTAAHLSEEEVIGDEVQGAAFGHGGLGVPVTISFETRFMFTFDKGHRPRITVTGVGRALLLS